MKVINLKLDKAKKYVIACSYGPDSMALLSSAIKSDLNIVVAHVNYHKREESNFEEDSLVKYCAERNIPCEVLDTTSLKPNKNFQEWARELRYEFFARVVAKYGADAVLVAHQEDDLIETYLMQEKRGNVVKYRGIAEENVIFGVKVIRPLLGYSKQYLTEYDKENDVPFSIDKSNLTNDYDRNKIRHQIVEKMSKEERQKIVDVCESGEKQIVCKTSYSINEFKEMTYRQIVYVLDYFMNSVNEHVDISKGFVQEIKRAIESKHNVSFEITESVLVQKNYDEINIVNASKLGKYEFNFNKKFENEFIEIDFENGTEDRGFSCENKKLKIKNISEEDNYNICNYSKNIKRLFIDWKMPLFLRKVWPGIYDETGTLLYIPRYRKTFKDNHKSKMKIDVSYFQKF